MNLRSLLLCLLFHSAESMTRREWVHALRKVIAGRILGEVLLPPKPDLPLVFAFTVERILQIDESVGELELQGRAYMTWVDQDTRWTPSEYGNVTSLPMAESSLWTPTLEVRSAAAEVPVSAEPSRVLVSPNGQCRLTRLLKLRLFTGPIRRGRTSVHIQFSLKGEENDGVDFVFWEVESPAFPYRREPPPLVPKEAWGRLSPLWVVEEASAVRARQARLVYVLSVARKQLAWAELFTIRAVGLLAAFFFAFVFSLGDPGRRQHRFFGLFAALCLQLVTELLARSFLLFQGHALSDAQLESRREVVFLGGWVLCVVESFGVFLLLSWAPRSLSKPLSPAAQRLLWALLRGTCQRPMERRLLSRLPRPPSVLSASAVPLRMMGMQSSLYDSGLSTASSASAEPPPPPIPQLPRCASNEDGRLNDSGGIEMPLFRQSPETPPPLAFHPNYGTRLHHLGMVRNASGCSRAATTIARTGSSGSGGSSEPPRFARRDAVLAVDRLCPFLLAPAALFLLYSTS